MTLFDLLASSPPFFIGVVLVLGLLVGSFLNVVIYRVPVMLDRQWRDQCAELAADAQKGPSASATQAPGAPVPAAPAPRPPFNLVVPRSACPSCKAPITALQNIPVLSYLFLRGRCASCAAPISVRYPLIEALTGVLSAAVAWKFGFGLAGGAALVLTWFLVALTFIDVDTQLLPDNMTLPLMWIGLFLSLWGHPVDFSPAHTGPASAWASHGARGLGATDSSDVASAMAHGLAAQSLTGPSAALFPIPVDMQSSILGAIVGYLSLWSVYHLFQLLTGKEGMGYGDFKLFAALGAWLGWKMLLPIILVAAAVGAVTGIGMIALCGRDRGMPIAFGPFLAASGWLMLMFGHELVTGYLGMYSARP